MSEISEKITGKRIYALAVMSKIMIIVFTFISSALINRVLGPAMKGEYSYIINIVHILVPIFSFGIGQTYSTYRKKYGIEALNTFVVLTILQSVISFIGFALVYLLKVNSYLAIALLLSTASVLRGNLACIAGIEDIKKRDVTSIIYKLIYMILVLIAFLFNIKNVKVMLLLFIIDEIIVIVGTFYKYKFKLNLHFLKKHKSNVRQIYKLGFISMLMTLMMTFNYSIDTIFLKKMCSTTVVGLYSVGVQLANMLWLIPDAFKDVIFSKASKGEVSKEIVTITKLCLYIAIIIIMVFSFFGKFFINIAYGREYIESYGTTIVIFMGCLSMIIYKLIHPIYIAKGKQLLVLIILVISVIINVISNFLTIPRFGMMGAAMSSVLSYSVCGGGFLIIFCRENKFKVLDFFIMRKSELHYLKNMLKKKKEKIN